MVDLRFEMCFRCKFLQVRMSLLCIRAVMLLSCWCWTLSAMWCDHVFVFFCERHCWSAQRAFCQVGSLLYQSLSYPVLNNHSQCAPHCSLFKFSTRQAPSWSSKSPQPAHHMAKGPYVTTLCVLSPFFLCHLASNEQHNGSSLPSKWTQICVPVCFKHLLRPHLAESALGWVAMWFSCLRASSCRQMQSERSLGRKRKVGQEMEMDT